MWCVVGYSNSLGYMVCKMGFKTLADARKWGKANNVINGFTERIKVVGRSYVSLGSRIL
jgi:hypothetical protein